MIKAVFVSPLRFLFSFFFFSLFLVALGLRCCVRAFSSCGGQGLVFIAVRGLLIVVASLLRSTGSRHMGSVVVARGLSSCGTRA